jgi:cellobiose phosphorylase
MYIGEARWEKGFISASSCGRLPADPGNFANRDQSRWWYMTQVGGKIVGADMDREKFVGAYRSFDNPQVIEAGKCTNSVGFSDNLCGSIQSDIELAPGESKEIVVLLGIGNAKEEGARIKKEFGSKALALFIKPPSVEVIRERLNSRNTDTTETISKRVAKAAKELEYAQKFDYIIINDDLNKAKEEIVKVTSDFFNFK